VGVAVGRGSCRDKSRCSPSLAEALAVAGVLVVLPVWTATSAHCGAVVVGVRHEAWHELVLTVTAATALHRDRVKLCSAFLFVLFFYFFLRRLRGRISADDDSG